MTETIYIKTREGKDSKVIIGPVEENLEKLANPKERRVIVITDAKVHSHLRPLIDAYEHIVIGQGESNKTLNTLEGIYRGLLKKNADRSTFILGVGGGIVTDITGFAASTYMRGLDFGFVPTTLLSQVDASVGGKNGVNFDGYKNIVGVFNQPEFVICDPALLRTLPEREFHAGLAEIIKMGIICDAELFGMFEKHTFDDLRNDGTLLKEAITRAVKAKAAVVQRDELEAGERRKLNLGHTFAHAMEKQMQAFSHGEAVAAGIVLISDTAARMGKLPRKDAARITKVIDKMGLPTEYPIEVRKLLSAVKYDKKRDKDTIYIVYPTSIGDCTTRQLQLSELEGIFLAANGDA